MPRRQYRTQIQLTEQSFQQLDVGGHHRRQLSTSPNAVPFRGVGVYPDRRRSLDSVCPACSQLLLREDTLGLFARLLDAESSSLRRAHLIPKDSFNTTAHYQGCGLCYALKRCFREELASTERLFQNDSNVLEFPFSFHPEERTITFHHPRDPEAKSVAFELVAFQGSDTWRVIRRRPPEVEVASYRSFTQATHWLQDCVNQHSSRACPILKKTPLPKRVIDVSGVHPRLHFSEGASAKYVCLSYCWGQSWRKQTVTTTANVQRHTDRIIFENLPRTIQDAITVTRRLNLKYIWIDRLCIVQDDEVQREKELEKMGEIFANAYVTISAATAINSEKGFLEGRELLSRAYTRPIKIPSFSPNGLRDHVMLYQRGSATTREPIHHRAWTLQEDLLSPRLLFYGDFELVWACATCVKTISGIQAEICDTGETEMARLRRLFTNESAYDKSDIMTLWEDLIREYSRRKLSRSDDKLPALSGLAMKFEHLIQGEYLAGLWSCWLPTHLLWKITGPSGSGKDQHDSGPWRAPTWSWLSVDSPVDIELEKKETFSALAKIENYAIAPVRSFNLFGRLKSASITLKGIVNEASDEMMHQIIDYKSENSKGRVEVVLDTEPIMGSNSYPEYTFLTIGSVTRPPKSAVNSHANGDSPKPLMRKQSDGEGTIALGIVLSPSGEDASSYQRVGWFKSLPSQREYLTGKERVVIIT